MEEMKTSRPSPYATASCFSKLTFWWINPIVQEGNRRALTTSDLFDVTPSDDATLLATKLGRGWEHEMKVSKKKTQEPNLFKTVLLVFKNDFFFLGIFAFLIEAIRVLQPFLIGQLIDYFQTETELTALDVSVIAVLLALSGSMRLLIDPWFYFLSDNLDMRMKSSVGCLIYRKVLRLSSQALHMTTSGKIVNHLSTDLEMFNLASESFHYAWVIPLDVVLIIYFMYQYVGTASLTLIPLIICVVPLQAAIGLLFGKLRWRVADKTDKRVHMMHEIIAGMRVIKMYCWEEPFGKLIIHLRQKEFRLIWMATMLRALNVFVYMISSFVMAIVVLATAWKLNIPLTATVVFTTLGWIEVIRTNVFLLLFLLVEICVSLSASLNRIKDFLMLDEKSIFSSEKTRVCQSIEPGHHNAVSITHMCATWFTQQADNKRGIFSLSDINIDIKKKELIAVIGGVGSGKSSLLMTLLGELPVTSGAININGTIGYAAQQPWVICGTLRENILFEQNYDAEKYRKVVHVCALDKDIAQMSHGDQTMVGERGLLLSGGQKARVTLARTIYKDSDIYLLDDPLGAVDTEVGKHIFNKCICEYLGNKTRILVTHHVQYLKHVGRIIGLKNGNVVSIGIYDEIMKRSDESSMILEELQNEEVEQKYGHAVLTELKSEKNDLEEEFMEKSNVEWSVYKEVIASGYPKVTVPLLLVLMIISKTSFVYADWHLAAWTEFQITMVSNNVPSTSLSNVSSGSTEFPLSNTTFTSSANHPASSTNNEYIYIYIVAIVLHIIVIFVMTGVYFTTLVTAGERLRNRMFQKVIGAKVQFFDANPVGQILNRFTRDMGIMDDQIPKISYAAFELGFRALALVIATCVINPVLIVPLCLLSLLLAVIKTHSIDTTRNLKRIEAVTKSPIYSLLSDTLRGLQTIRSLDMSDDFVKAFEEHQNKHTAARFLFAASFRWFVVRTLSAVMAYFVLAISLSLILKDVVGLTGGLYGMSLLYILMLADPFEVFLRKVAETETYMTSVERITSYTRLEQETNNVVSTIPPPTWPSQGCITLKDMSLKYTEQSQMVLKNINCTINSKEKVGIVGRTGAGKSSLLAALLRLAEPTGSIIIDGEDICRVRLRELRGNISVIPQDPILFSGTVRQNLDPFEEYSEMKLWDSLDQVQMKKKVESLPRQLYTEMSGGGTNFSVGQRQLVCLARAVLRHNKILILDEATANVDHKTDALIQKTIRERFRDCTVLTVAHRLHTIMDSDRVMVLDGGEVKEYDAPYKLLQNENGFFRNLVEQTGKAQVQYLNNIAFKSYKETL